MGERVSFQAGAADAGKRVDVVVAERVTDLTRSSAQHLVGTGAVRVNGSAVKAARRMQAGDRVEVEVDLPPALSAQPEEIPLHVVYQDADLAIIDKPAGLVVHPGAGHLSGTLANALAARFPRAREVGTDERPGIVHRLDKDTSGLLVVALSPQAHVDLQRQIAAHTAGRRYLALAAGHLEPEEGIIEAPIGRDPKDRKRMAVHGAASRPARTAYRVLEYLPGFTFLEARLDTGRTHQIRVHFAALGHPLAGDRTYRGPTVPGLERQFLHATGLSLVSPSSGEKLEFGSPLPPDLSQVLSDLRSHS